MTSVAKLTLNESTGSLLARVRAAAGSTDRPPSGDLRLMLVVPAGLRLGDIDLRLMRREARAGGLGLALITSDAALRTRAGRLGIATFRSVAQGERARWQRLPADKRTAAPPGGEAAVSAPFGAGLFAKRSPTGWQPASFARSFVRGPSPWWATLLLVVVLLGLLAMLGGAFVVLVPSATVTVAPGSSPTQVKLSLLAAQDAETDPDAGVVPARVLSAQVSGEGRTRTTGRSQEAAGKARGQALFINRTGQPVTVPAGTVISTATGNDARFTTTLDAPLTPNGRTEVPVEAILPGPTGNVRAGTVTRVEGPLTLSLLVTNNAAFSGGTTAQVGVVAEEDKERLQAELFEKLKEQGYEALNQKLEPGSFIPPETVTYLALSPTFAPFVGEVSDDLFLNMSVQAVGLVVDTEAGQEVALARLQDAMPPGTRLISDTLRYVPGGIAVKDPKTVSFSITAEGSLLDAIDKRDIRGAVLGMTPEEASRALMERFALAAPPDIRLGPDWLPYIVPTNLPVVPWRIRVNVDWDAAAQLSQQPR